MLNMSLFSSQIAAPMVLFLRHKKALGRQCTATYYTLRSLDRFLHQTDALDLDAAAFLKWSEGQKHVASGVRRRSMMVIRAFSLYRRRSEPDCYVPEASLFPPEHTPCRPYVFSEAEIAQLLQQIQLLKRFSHCPLRSEAARLALVLLYSAGLRLGELLRLEVQDYDPTEQTLHVRASKFHKSRRLPLSSDAAFEMGTYLAARQRLGRPGDRARMLLWNGSEQATGYSKGRLRSTMWELLDGAGIRNSDGRRPTIHCLRHTFAVHALLRWYRSGVELQSRLPHLATYMGHVSIVSTERYLHFVEQLASAASGRFQARSAKVLGMQAEPEERQL